MRWTLLFTALVLMTVISVASAAIPHNISYQGVLKDAGGTIVPDGPYDLTFSIYDLSSTLQWTETQTIPVTSGVFNAIMGIVNPINLNFENQYTLGIAIGGDPELIPRVPVTAVGYALNAERLDGLSATAFAPASHAHALDNLSDVDVTGAGDGQVLTYDSGSGDWVATTVSTGGDDDWVVNGSEMYAGVSGDVGIGTSNPGYKLHVVEDINDIMGIKIENNDTGSSSCERISFSDENGDIAGIAIWDEDNASYGGQMRIFNNRPSGSIYLGNGDGSIKLDETGNVGIGNNSPSSALDVGGTIEMTGFQMSSGAASGEVLTSDASGVGTWQSLSGITDDDWIIDGSDIYRLDGRVGIGAIPDAAKSAAGGRDGDRTPSTSKVYISGANEGLYTRATFNNDSADGRAAIYGMRVSSLSNPGSGYHNNSTNAAVTGYNSWGDSYTFGVTGYTWFDQVRTGGILGSKYDGSVWGALGYHDENTDDWGLYTPNNAYVGNTLNVISSSDRAGQFESDATVTYPHVLHSEYTGTTTTDATAVYGKSVPQAGWGTGGYFQGGYFGAVGNVPSSSNGGNHIGVWGYVGGSPGYNYGVWGQATNSSSYYNVGVYAEARNGTYNYAGYFYGNTHVSGTLSKSAGSFKIDHPLEPESKYLSHSFVESPDMKNIYDGVVKLDSGGEAWIELPEWFEALNEEFRYQLTCVGGYAQVYVAEEVSGNQFKIAGGSAGLKVSWQLTGIRHDPYAEKFRIPVEEMKPAHAQGTYMVPEAYNMPESRGEMYESQSEVARKQAALDN